MMDRPPEFAVDDRNFDDALARAGRRRRRRHLVVGSASTVLGVVIAVAVLASTSSGVDTLDVTPAGSPPSQTTTATAIPAPTRGSASAAPSPAPSVGGGGAGDLPAFETPSPPPLSVTARPRTTPPTTTAPGPTISTSMTRSRTSYDANSVCTDASGRPATGWCMGLTGDGHPHGRSGRPTTLGIGLCRLPGVDGTAHFPGTLEADLSLVKEGSADREIWHYADQHPNREFSHRYRVDGGTCLVWQTTWSVIDNDGAAIEAGDYTLNVSVNADNVVTPNNALVQSYRFTVD